MLKISGPILGDWSSVQYFAKEKNVSRVLTSPFPDIQIPRMSFSELAFRYMEEYGERTFLIEDSTGEEYSYSRVLFETRQFAGALRRLGVTLGDVVCLFSGNHVQYVISILAVTALGAAVTYANPLGTIGELLTQTEQTKSVYIVADDQNYVVAKTVFNRLNHVKGVIVLGSNTLEDCLLYKTLMEGETEPLEAPVSIGDLGRAAMHIPFSSGTTGLPKGVVISHENSVASVFLMSTEYFSLVEAEDVTLLVLPLFHLYAVLMVQYAMAKGSKVVILSRFKPRSFLGAIERRKVTFIPLVPPLALFLTESPLTAEYDLSTWQVAFCAAASLAPTIAQRLKNKMNLRKILQGYGMTETGFTIVTPRYNQHLESVGVVLQNTEIKVIDSDTREILPPYARGEICVRTPQITPGYLNNESATLELIDYEGWAHTGDIGYYDDNGRFYFLERVKEIFKNKGHQVAPAELECLLVTHPMIVDAAVVGTPDARAGELPRAFVVLRSGARCTQQDIQAFIAGLSSPEKHLQGGVFFLESIPKSITGKIDRRKLRALYI